MRAVGMRNGSVFLPKPHKTSTKRLPLPAPHPTKKEEDKLALLDEEFSLMDMWSCQTTLTSSQTACYTDCKVHRQKGISLAHRKHASMCSPL